MKKSSTNSTLILLIFLILCSCSRRYAIADFEEQTVDHQIVAVLPFGMEYTGLLPEDVDVDDIEEVEEKISVEIQKSFATQLISADVSNKRKLRVRVQSPNRTNHLLNEAGITIREAWISDPGKLFEVLNVDGIVFGEFYYNQILPDEASLGIEIGRRAANVLGAFTGVIIPSDISNSKEMYVNYTLIGRESNNVLWTTEIARDGNYNDSIADLLTRANRTSACRFPYRN